MEKNPKYLYRGVIVDYDLIDEVALGDMDLVPPNKAILDENGRKVVLDGNEYGLYMTDNPYVARTYSTPSFHGKVLSKAIDLNYGKGVEYVNLPAVGVSYDIDSTGLDVKIPWITPELKAIYNNGFEGNEWITDMVPKDRYQVTRVVVGSDLLHIPEVVELGSAADIRRNIKKVIDKRERHLNDLISELKKLTPKKRMELTPLEMNMFKTLLGDNGAKYINVNVEHVEIKTMDDALRYLMSMYYFNNTQRLDFNNLCYIESLRSRLSGNNEIEDLLNLLYMDITESVEEHDEMMIARNKFMMLKILNNLLETVESKLEKDIDNPELKRRKEILTEQIHLVER